jgi:pimeloyl-ACP methyl ester carboxylesterase
MTETVESADRTTIAYEVEGRGPALIIIGGAFNHRHSPDVLRSALAQDLTVYVHDRRGRGDSGDTDPYATERELDDLAAVIAAAGGTAMVYGHSSGAILALEAAAAGFDIPRLAVYEPPYTYDATEPPRGDTLAKVRAALAVDDFGTAVELFLAETGMDAATIDTVKLAPFWPAMVAMAPTTAYDLTIVGDGRVPADRFASITVPTLVIDGGMSPPWAARATDAVSSAIRGSERLTVAAQHHGVDQVVLAPVLREFFMR